VSDSEKRVGMLGNLPRGLIFIVSAPAGTGKTTLVDRLCAELPEVRRSISCTTRAAREGERDGEAYRFLSTEQFVSHEARGEFLECAQVFGNLYGTLRSDVEAILDRGQHVVLVIDTQGALQLRDKVEAITIFLMPPSLDALKERLEKRGSDSAESIAVRLAWAQHELELAQRYDYIVCNDRLDTAYAVLRSIVIAEEHRNRQKIERGSHGIK
jgi:guanylate kinase